MNSGMKPSITPKAKEGHGETFCPRTGSKSETDMISFLPHDAIGDECFRDESRLGVLGALSCSSPTSVTSIVVWTSVTSGFNFGIGAFVVNGRSSNSNTTASSSASCLDISWIDGAAQPFDSTLDELEVFEATCCVCGCTNSALVMALASTS